jgi:hypothetical protein
MPAISDTKGRVIEFPEGTPADTIRRAMLPKPDDGALLKAAVKMAVDEEKKKDAAQEAVSKAIEALNTKAEIKALSELVETLADELKKTRKSSEQNTEHVVSAISGLLSEMKLNRMTPFEISIDENGNKIMRRTARH